MAKEKRFTKQQERTIKSFRKAYARLGRDGLLFIPSDLEGGFIAQSKYESPYKKSWIHEPHVSYTFDDYLEQNDLPIAEVEG